MGGICLAERDKYPLGFLKLGLPVCKKIELGKLAVQLYPAGSFNNFGILLNDGTCVRIVLQRGIPLVQTGIDDSQQTFRIGYLKMPLPMQFFFQRQCLQTVFLRLCIVLQIQVCRAESLISSCKRILVRGGLFLQQVQSFQQRLYGSCIICVLLRCDSFQIKLIDRILCFGCDLCSRPAPDTASGQ